MSDKTAEAAKPRQLVADPEVQAMARIHKILSPLPAEAQKRICAWMTARVQQPQEPKT